MSNNRKRDSGLGSGSQPQSIRSLKMGTAKLVEGRVGVDFVSWRTRTMGSGIAIWITMCGGGGGDSGDGGLVKRDGGYPCLRVALG